MKRLKEPLTITIETEEELFSLWHRLNSQGELYTTHDSYDYESWLGKVNKVDYRFDDLILNDKIINRLFWIVEGGIQDRGLIKQDD